MVARGAGAAGPVLLACRQWDPLGLARRLPCLGVGAWRSAPLLPWRMWCPVRVCAALAAGSGGSGRYLVLCLSRFPFPAPRVPRCVWRAVPSRCPLPSLAGKPFHAVCAFRQPPHVPSAYTSCYHRRPCPATQTTGSAWEPRTASPTAPTAGTSTPTTASGQQPQPHPPPPATPASSGHSPTPSGTTREGTTWRTRRTTHGP